jgi:RNA polymerase sigma factor (sigma-70 family)
MRHLRQWAARRDDDPSSDRELLRRFAVHGEEAAFAVLVRRYGSMVLSVCRRILHRPEDAEDAFQAAFLVLLRRSGTHPWHECVGGWLHRVATRIALRLRADAARRAAELPRAEEGVGGDPLEQVTARELFAAFDEELARLPQRYLTPLLLCCLQGKTQEQAAEQLACSLSTIRRRLEQGRRLLHTRLTRRGLELPAALAAVLLAREASAGVPAPLRVALLQTLNGSAPARVAALAESILRTAILTPVKATAALILLLGVLAAGAGLAASHFLTSNPPETGIAAHAQPDPPKSDKAERTDLYGDPLPPRALLRLGTVRFRSRDFLGGVAFSADGKMLAAGGYGGSILLYDAATGRKLRQLKSLTNQFPTVAFAPDGKTLAAASSRTIQIWNFATGEELRRFDIKVSKDAGGYDFRTLVPLVFSHDGKSLAYVAPDHSIHIGEVKTGKELVTVSGHQESIRCLAFSPDDKTFFSASGASARIWQVATGKEVRKISLERRHARGQPEPLCFSPDVKTLAVGLYESLPPNKGGNVWRDAHPVAFIDLETGEQTRKLEPQPGRMKAASFSPDGKILAAMNGVPTIVGNFQSDDNNQIHVWEAATGKLLWDAPAYAEHLHQGPCQLAFSPDGKKLAASATACALHVWDVARGREDSQRAQSHHDQTWCVVFSPDGQTVASGSADHAIALWDADTGKERLRLLGHQGTVSSLAFSPDAKLLASSCRMNDHTVRLWDLTTGKELRQYWVPSVPLGNGAGLGVATWVAFAANGKILAAGGTDHKLRLWDVATGKELFNRAVRGLPALPTGGDVFKSFTFDLVFSSDGRVLAFTIDGTIYVVDVAAGQALFQFDKGGLVLALSPDGKTLLCRAGNFLEVASGRDLHKVDLPEGHAAAVFSPDGRIVAVSAGEADATIRLFGVATGKELLRLHGHEALAPSLAFSPDGTKLASGHWDSTALIWDVSAARRAGSRQRPESAGDLEHLWTQLRDTDASKAHVALWTLVDAPDKAVPFLKEHLHPMPRVSAERLRRLIADLDADDFARREEASRNLAKLGSEAEPALRKVLEEKPTLELRRRVQALLDSLACQTEMTPDALRQLRAIQVLEQIGSPEARQILASLAQGAPAAPATRDAAAALARLEHRASTR